MSALLLLAALLSSATAPSPIVTAPPPCRPIPGWEAIAKRRDLDFLVLGEMHGSQEMPQIFGDAVCLTAASRPIVVALEQAELDQGAIDSFMASDRGEAARAVFSKARLWHMARDGRSSEAYFHLFEVLRAIKAAGTISKVIAFRPTYSPTLTSPAALEEAMAQRLIAAAHPGSTVMVLVGNVHARQADPARPYRTMASYLPPERTLSLDVRGNGGTIWACMGDPMVCGPQPTGGHPQNRHVDLKPAPGQFYSGTLYLGSTTTASPPHADNAPPIGQRA